MAEPKFTGDKKVPLKSPLAAPEKAFIKWLTPRFPRFLEGYHLTLMTILWSGGAVLCGWLARENIHWLWMGAGLQVAQWFTDSLDGSLGRHRDTGIPKWGYYMDHFLDYVFMACGVIGLALLLDGTDRFLMMVLMPIVVSFMVSSYLAFSATGEFKITFLGVGPTELRLLMIMVYASVVIFGKGILSAPLPYITGVLSAVICLVIYRTQKYIWAIDMNDKARRLAAEAEKKSELVKESADG